MMTLKQLFNDIVEKENALRIFLLENDPKYQEWLEDQDLKAIQDYETYHNQSCEFDGKYD